MRDACAILIFVLLCVLCRVRAQNATDANSTISDSNGNNTVVMTVAGACGNGALDAGELCDHSKMVDSSCKPDCSGCVAFYEVSNSMPGVCELNILIIGAGSAVIVAVVCLVFIVALVCSIVKKRKKQRKEKLAGVGAAFHSARVDQAYPPPANAYDASSRTAVANAAPYTPPTQRSNSVLPPPVSQRGSMATPAAGGYPQPSFRSANGASGYDQQSSTSYTGGGGGSAMMSPLGQPGFQSARMDPVSMRGPSMSLTTQAPAQQAGAEYYISIVELQLEGEIGRGAYGVVFQGRHRGIEVAIKQLDVKGGVNSPEYDDQLNEFKEEADFMMKLPPHPNVVALIGVTPPPNFWIVTEFLSRGSLYTLLHSAEKITDTQQRNIIRGIAAGMAHLHAQKIVHRDLAARNILLDNALNAKISDFGLSRFGGEDEEIKTKSDVGPIKWMSPEAIKDKVYSQKSDVWSFGVTVWEVLTRQNPYPQMDLIQVATNVCYKNLCPETPRGTPNDIADILQRCFQRKADLRPHMREISQLLG